MADRLTAKEVVARLRALNSQAFAILTEVNEYVGGTGRWADAIGMSLWKSRGVELHGYEIKVSRTDWLREMKNPQKADAVCKYCDRWWIVAGETGIVKDGELPETWGLMEPHGATLRTIVKAPLLSPVPIDRAFLASIFRRAAEQSADAEAITAASHEGYLRGVKVGEERRSTRMERDPDALLRKAVEEFEKASGVRIMEYSGRHYGEAFAAVLRGDHKRDVQQLEQIHRLCSDIIQQIERIKGNPAIVG